MNPSVTSRDDTVHSLKNAAQNIRDDARKTAGEVKNDLSATAVRAGREVRDFISSTSDELSHASETVTTHVHNKPVQSSLIALGIGYIIGTLLHR